MNAPCLNFRALHDKQLIGQDFFQPYPDVIFTFEMHLPEPPDMVDVHNPLDAPIELDVIDASSLFANAPDAIVEALFFRLWMFKADAPPIRMAEPHPETGETLFRGSTGCIPIHDTAAAALTYIRQKARFFSQRVVVQPGQSIVIDNRRQMVSFPAKVTVELRYLSDDDTDALPVPAGLLPPPSTETHHVHA